MNPNMDINGTTPEEPRNGMNAPSLQELVGRITDENRHEAIDWGPPVGLEEW
jgi:antitoxin component of MazEF toxin-antitoxin module